MTTVLFGFVAGLVVAVVTAPVGVSDAVFLLPVQVGTRPTTAGSAGSALVRA
nr:hypothetical protein [Frankia nepalensis]